MPTRLGLVALLLSGWLKQLFARRFGNSAIRAPTGDAGWTYVQHQPNIFRHGLYIMSRVIPLLFLSFITTAIRSHIVSIVL